MVGYFVAQAADTKIIVTAYGNPRGRSFPSKGHQSRVDGDACEPSSDVGSALEVPYVNKCSQQCVLHCVFGILTGSRYAMSHAKKLLSILFRKPGEVHFV
jgi:hypothetical protein